MSLLVFTYNDLILYSCAIFSLQWFLRQTKVNLKKETRSFEIIVWGFIKATIIISRFSFLIILGPSLMFCYSFKNTQYVLSVYHVLGNVGCGWGTRIQNQLSKICNICSLLITDWEVLKARKGVKKIFNSGPTFSAYTTFFEI